MYTMMFAVYKYICYHLDLVHTYYNSLNNYPASCTYDIYLYNVKYTVQQKGIISIICMGYIPMSHF